MLYFRITVLSIIFAALLLATVSADEIDWSDPESIDPYADGITDSMDVDISEFQETAKEAYNDAEYEKAAKYYLACVKFDPGNGLDVYNLACCYGLLGDAELAAHFVEKAVGSGFDNLDWIQHDPDFEGVRGRNSFR